MTTTEVIEQAIELLEIALSFDGDVFGWRHNNVVDSLSDLREVIKREEAQTAGSVGYVFYNENSDSPSMEANILRDDLVKHGDELFTHPTPATSGEREELISDCNLYVKVGVHMQARTLVKRCADMLAADAQCPAGFNSPAELQRHNDYMSGFNEATKRAQQVAVPQCFKWPKPPPFKGQSPVLFDDGYEEGWAKAISTVQSILTSAQQPPKGEQV